MSRVEIVTRSGSWFSFEDPQQDSILIEDIAYALSHLNRFTGHVGAYNVAEHSWRVSMAVSVKHAMAGLLHDAAEAYIGDVNSPLKSLLPDYRKIEARVHDAISTRFGISSTIPDEVHIADRRMYLTECRDLRDGMGSKRGFLEPYGHKIIPWRAEDAERLFLQRFEVLAKVMLDADDRRKSLTQGNRLVYNECAG